MKGKILDFSIQSNAGAISSEDGTLQFTVRIGKEIHILLAGELPHF